MAVTQIGDPRLQALFGANDPREAGVRPTVRLPRRGLPPAALAVSAAVAALLLFMVLEGRRTGQVEPSVRVRAADQNASTWEAPALYIPPVQAPSRPVAPVTVPQPSPAIGPSRVRRPATDPFPQAIVYAPPPVPQMSMPQPPPTRPRAPGGASLVIDTGAASQGANVGAGAPGASPLASSQGGGRMRASALANRSSTVPQGYVIPAVLETGFDSTKPGFARAIVSRDVRSFDGRKVLIPRGSRLIGEYRSEVASGQKRAIITWTRLIRPDGMTIAMDSPAVDTLGRGGVPARVNSHFFERMGNVLLQSTLSLGTALAGRSVSGPVVVLPNATAGNVQQLMPQPDFVPTLTVPPGKSISVFVAHDLDFSSAGGT